MEVETPADIREGGNLCQERAYADSGSASDRVTGYSGIGRNGSVGCSRGDRGGSPGKIWSGHENNEEYRKRYMKILYYPALNNKEEKARNNEDK